MNPLALWFADGRILFVGLGLHVLGQSLLFRARRPRTQIPARILVILGMTLVLLSATPLPRWAILLWIGTALACFWPHNSHARKRKAEIRLSGAIVLLLLLELPWHRPPPIFLPPNATLHVLGDSLSAGTGMGEHLWTDTFARHLQVTLHNHAQPGATLSDGLRQAESLPADPATVLIFLGGNDLLGTATARQFETDLATLLDTLQAQGHTLLLQELPLLPFRADFGRAQRRQAASRQLKLLPKRLITRALAPTGATLDGLHLSDTGHRLLAESLASHFRTSEN